jgi:hypothetical protein
MPNETYTTTTLLRTDRYVSILGLYNTSWTISNEMSSRATGNVLNTQFSTGTSPAMNHIVLWSYLMPTASPEEPHFTDKAETEWGTLPEWQHFWSLHLPSDLTYSSVGIFLFRSFWFGSHVVYATRDVPTAELPVLGFMTRGMNDVHNWQPAWFQLIIPEYNLDLVWDRACSKSNTWNPEIQRQQILNNFTWTWILSRLPRNTHLVILDAASTIDVPLRGPPGWGLGVRLTNAHRKN